MALDFGKLDFAVAFNRQTAFPLDAKSYFESLESAQAAAQSADAAGSKTTTYYFGQQIAVVENGVATLYIIQPDKTLKEVGGKIDVNENIFQKTAEGKLDIIGFASAVAGAQAVKGADGKISWVKPDTTTVEGLTTTVTQLANTVNGYTDGEGVAHEGLGAKVSTLETKVANTYTKAEVDSKVSAVMRYKGSKDTYADLPTEGNVIGDVWNIATADTAQGIKAGDNVAWNGTGWDILGGAVDLSGYATKTDLNSKVDKVEGKGLSSNDYTDAAKAKVDALALVATSGDYDDLTNKPTIPAPVTEQTVSDWGFTKNTGTYSKPTGGIPKADLANNVQASLGKADTALQEHQSLAAYRTAAAQDIIDNGKQDKITSTNKLSYSLISDTPTIPTVPSALKNPHAITFTGASTGTYDGSSALTINIPESDADTYTQFAQVVISLPLSDWTGSSTFTNTIAISSVKADTIVIASPAPSDKDAFAFSNVYCSAQAEGSLTFTAKTKPATDLTANLIIVTLPEGATAAANTCSLTVAGWSSNTQTVSITGMAADRIVIIGPVADSIDVCKTNAVYCSAQGNGTLTFKCQTTPSVAITMNVIMI